MPPSPQGAKDLFLTALDLPLASRDAFLAEACGEDTALRLEVESLLQFHEAANTGDAKPSPEHHHPEFAPGEVFAGRYRMVERIGSGGMGDVWCADDLVLETEVALKVIGSAGSAARERILMEVRLARQITHPAVCRVFDVGEAQGLIFFSMELIRGEDLAALLRRVGRLPSEKVVDIGRQLCAGLAAAHAQGVLHRDLKPANVLIDNDGFVRISDFGIAIPRREADRHSFTGTPAYMAPEQRTPGMPVSERTDVYALGLVLYDLLVGGHVRSQIKDGTPLPRPSALLTGVDPQLDRVIMTALSRDPNDRPSSVREMATMLAMVGTEEKAGSKRNQTPLPDWKNSPWAAGLALAAAIVILIIGSSFLVSPSAGTLNERDTIVLADFENGTGEPVFDGTLKVALAVALEQSPFLKVFPDERARETLRLMERSPGETITRSLAREIAQREQLKAFLSGSIVRLGQNYVLGLEAINAETGDVMAREQSEAANKEQVLSALGGAISRLRQKLGESLPSVQEFDVPLPRATTASLDALHAYALALYQGREVPRLEAIPHLKRAIELDPTFAMAHALLSAVYANTGQSALAPEFSKRAFDLRDRVSDRERFFISWRYYRDAIQAWDKALELARSWTATYPREAFAFNALGNALIRLGYFEQSVEPLREAIRLDPQFVPAYGNLAGSLLALQRLDEARATLNLAADRKLNFIGASRLSYLLAFVQGDTETMARELEASIGLRQTNSAFGWQAHASAAGGRVKTAHDQYRRGIQMSLHGGFTEVAAQLMVEDGEMHAAVGQCRDALSEVSEGLRLARDNATLERAGRVLALCGARDEAMEVAGELRRRFPEATLTINLCIPVIAAAGALRQGEPAQAIEMLEPARPYDHAPSGEFWPLYLRGQAYLQLKNGPAAATEFQYIVDHQGEVPASVLYAPAHLGLAKSKALMNDAGAARAAYGRLLELWKSSDPDLQPLEEARAAYARLQ
jgi:serine/threonine protein kinase/tetratricopeptide (TPR) repeat protein